MKNLFLLKIKSEQGVPAETAGTTLRFMVDEVINLIPKADFYNKTMRCKHTLPPESSHWNAAFIFRLLG